VAISRPDSQLKPEIATPRYARFAKTRLKIAG
jgi:hypothetical protein